MWTDTATAIHVSELQRGAQLKERVAAEHGGDERRVGFEDVVHLRQGAGQVVDPVKREGAEDGIEGVCGVGQGFFIGEDVAGEVQLVVEREGGVAVEERGGGVGGGEMRNARGDWGGFLCVGIWIWEGEGARDVTGVGTEVEDVGEMAIDVLDILLVFLHSLEANHAYEQALS